MASLKALLTDYEHTTYKAYPKTHRRADQHKKSPTKPKSDWAYAYHAFGYLSLSLCLRRWYSYILR